MDTQDQQLAAGDDGAPRNPNRRRFASTGVKATGVILTLASPPGMACVCKSPSGFKSGNLSSPGTQNVVCAGLSPGYWKNWPNAWPSGCYAVATKYRAATKFASVFPFGWTSLYQNATMMGILQNNEPSMDPYNLGAHLVSAYLNVKSGKINFLTVTKLKAIWHDLYTYGYYSPIAGTRWNAKEVSDYLASTEN